MEKRELVRLLVLNEICDDFENIDQIILKNVAPQAAKLGITVTRDDIAEELARLIDDGLAKAYDLTMDDPLGHPLPGMPNVERNETNAFRTYFYITKRGMEIHLSDFPTWPFDEDGNPVDWQPPPKSPRTAGSRPAPPPSSAPRRTR